MVVAFTSNIGLAKPDEAELALDWARNLELVEDNNLIIIDKMDVNYVTYAPTFVGAAANPSVGAGTIQGEYFQFQDIIIGSIAVTIGAGLAVGNGNYGFLLPFMPDLTFHTVATALSDNAGVASVVGEGYLTDNSAVATSGTVAVDLCTVGGTTPYARLVLETFVGKTARVFGNGQPFTLAIGDQWSFNFVYKKA
jgi:hypothetical protein